MFRRLKRLRTERPWLCLYHLMLHAAVVCLGLWKLIRGSWGHAGLCLLTLALFSLPGLLESALRLRLAPPLEITVTLFALCANIFGEMLGFYIRFPWWDAVLHVIWGFLAGLLGCAFLEAVQRAKLRPTAAALTALGFAALSGILWEFFEFTMDAFFPLDMQKDVWLQSVSSVLLNPSGANTAVTLVPETVTVDGSSWPGLLDPGLRDTVGDLFQNFLGSLAAALALLSPLGRGRRSGLLRGLMPLPICDAEVERDENE